MNKEKTLNIVLTVVSVLFIGVSGTLLYKYIKNKRKPNFDKTTSKNFWEKVLFGVISREYGGGKDCPSDCSSKGCYGKRYNDVLCLDSGTIGIAHFASGGLKKLYEVMDTQKYFNRSQSEMINNYASKSSGASDNQWWLDGFRKWVNEPKNNKVQDDLFKKSRQGAVDSAKQNGWKTDREFAIAVGVSNSFGNSGFRSKASMNNWNAEETLDWYSNQSTHKINRAIAINKWFPKDKERKIDL
jgi:hypothetical protein